MEKSGKHSDHILPGDAAHGNRGGGSMHAVSTQDVAGFMSAADKVALDNIATLTALADPNADRVVFWDDSAGGYAFLSMGASLTLSGTTLNLADGDKGDITVSASGATWTIDNGVVTTAKLGGDITTAGKALLDDADAAAQRATLAAAGTGVSNTFTTNQTIQGTADVLTLETTATTDRTTLRLNTNGSDWELGARGSAAGLPNTFYLYDLAAAKFRLIVDSSGNYGIGGDPSSAAGYTWLSVYNGTNGGIVEVKNNSVACRMQIDNTSAASIGTYTNHILYLLQNGSVRSMIDTNGYLLVGYTSSNGAYRLQVNSQIFATSATVATSDGRYKENVTPLDGALGLVCQLNPVQFDWKEHPVHNFDRAQPTVGFIAQEVQQVLGDKPYVASIVKANTCTLEAEERDEDGNITKPAVTEEFLGIAEGNMIALLTKAIQELKAEFDAYKASHP